MSGALDTDILEKVERSTSARQLFGTDKSKLHNLYKILAAGTHPDVFVKYPDLTIRSRAAFEKMQRYYDELTGKHIPSVTVSFGTWTVERGLTRGDVADIYAVKTADVDGMLKLPRSARDNDLMQAEVDSLRHLNDSKAGDAGKGLKADKHHDYQQYIPSLLDSFKVNGRIANVQSLVDSDYIPLSEFNSIWKNGLPTFRHIVWMGNRALSALGYSHYRGIIHGAVLPSHILFDATTHTMKLVDWCYSVPVKSTRIKAAVSAYKSLYAPEILRKLPPTSSTDIYMLMKSLATVNVVGGWPSAFKALIDWATAASQHSRPLYAWNLQERWKAAAQDLYGDPKFVKLELP